MKNKENLEEVAKRIYGSDESKDVEYYAFIAGAKWQQERMYSEEDLKEAFKGGNKMCWTDISQETQEPYYYDFNEWFEQFKKK